MGVREKKKLLTQIVFLNKLLYANTHGPGHPDYQAACHTWQTAHQVAVAKGLISAAQHRRRRRPIVLTVHNVTTARDLQSPQATRPPRRTSHQHLARNNFSTLQKLNAQPGVTVALRVDAGPHRQPASSTPPSRPPTWATYTLDAPGRPYVPRQRPVGRVEGVGSRGLKGRGREDGGSTRARGLGGAEGTHRSIHSDCPCPSPHPDLARGCFPPSVFSLPQVVCAMA